jgi:hypothetical protein
MKRKMQIRPRFYLKSSLAPDAVLAHIRDYLNSGKADCDGTVSSHHALLRVPESQIHYWSPQLTVQVEAANDGTVLRCLFSPMPAVWTMFVAIYAAIGFLGIVALIWGLVEWQLGIASKTLWLVPAAALGGVSAWLVAGYGQKLGHEQMVMLRQCLFDALPDLQESETT